MNAEHTNFAVCAFGQSGSSGLYDRARPDYPEIALQPIFESIKSGPNSGKRCKVVELGAGTGIFTRCLINADRGDQIESILSVEPSEGMREGFKKSVLDPQKFNTKGKTVDIAHGLFTEIPVSDESVDVVAIAQAWHWCIPQDHENSLIEIARTLKKNGILVLIWNLEDRESAKWVSQIRDVYEQYEKGVPQYRTGEWKKMFEAPSFSKLFSSPIDKHITRSVQTTRDGVKERILSKSYITALTPDERSNVLQKVDEALDGAEGYKWVDRESGIFEYPYVTDLYIFKKL
ncbi:methyltransferase [Acrasis kona]|uniref:Methyltransferase n=1 Tax=Acrasis kona TaxID=1008807 RepID=A0AAW2ZJN4_9EUKA